ncbi:MAG: lysozyme family protein [Candidatus Faecousia sp.]|nr:lysozyme family protein [Candidatus Faecousia sp.]
MLILVIVLVVMCFAGMMLASDENDMEILPVSEEVKAYEPIIQKYAKEHGIPDYVLLIEAVMMQESGGRGTDPMQCSECGFNTRYPHAPGSITDPEYSINVGIQNLADCLQIAECESPVDMDAIKLALQGYNYGQGYITWAMRKYGEYSKGNAIEFSLKTAEACGWSSYGDMDYVPHVLRYYPLGQIFYDPDTTQLIVEVAASQIGNVGGEPYWSWYGFTEHVEWCACFVSWCANKCGYLDTIIPKFAGCSTGVHWFKARNQWAERTITPEPGMIIFFDWDRDGVPDHTGIVEKSENSYVYTIEGNTSDSCHRRQYTVGNSQIFGYGIPAYN